MTVRYPQALTDFMISAVGRVDRRKENQSRDQFSRLSPIIERLKPKRILDIGSGLAYMNVFIAQTVPIEQVHLVDGDGSLPQQAGYKPDTQAWNDVELGAELVRLNVDVLVTGHQAVPEAIDVQVDLVTSYRSWGHHYPVSVYLKAVDRCLVPGGHVITDIRNNTNGLKDLKSIGLKIVEQISDPSAKCTRWLLVR